MEIYYDEKIIDFATLVKLFFGAHDPTTLNRQGPDRGTQYRSIAFYSNSKEKSMIDDLIQSLTDDKVFDVLSSQKYLN